MRCTHPHSSSAARWRNRHAACFARPGRDRGGNDVNGCRSRRCQPYSRYDGFQPSLIARRSCFTPAQLYYLGSDSAGLTQVFRIETDGVTQGQVTSEPVSVNEYDVSRVDGSIAYVANNQLLLLDADGSNRRIIADGGDIDPNNPFINTISSPVFSPDGQTLAYGHQGLRLYSFATGNSSLILENQIDDVGGGLFVPRELYSPERYSPDGTKLLITLGYYEGASSAIYYPATNALVRLVGGEGALICCDDTEWSADGASVY